MDCDFRSRIEIGHGRAAGYHREVLDTLGVKTVGVIEIDASKHTKIQKMGLRIFQSYEEAYAAAPQAWWDICSDEHLEPVRKIVRVNPKARILGEKPICRFDQIPELKQILDGFQGVFVVGENYESSELVEELKRFMEQFQLDIKSVIVEMDKNRIKDVIDERFIPHKITELEVTHMVTVLRRLFPTWQPTGQIDRNYEDMDIPPCKRFPEGTHLLRQGTVDIAYVANGVSINLFSSMIGRIKHSFPPFGLKPPISTGCVPVEDTATRYRIAAVKGIDKEGTEMTMVIFFEPIKGFERSQGALTVLRGNEVIVYKERISDNSMGTHLKAVLDCFAGKGGNPCPVERGVEVVELLHTLEAE